MVSKFALVTQLVPNRMKHTFALLPFHFQSNITKLVLSEHVLKSKLSLDMVFLSISEADVNSLFFDCFYDTCF